MSAPLHPALARTGSGICASSTFSMPTRVEFARGVGRERIGAEARGLGGSGSGSGSGDSTIARALLVTDPGLRSAGVCDPLLSSLAAAGLVTDVFDHVQGNPRDVHCLEGAELGRSTGANVLIGVGGGSAIDTAKCIALLITNGGHPRDWEDFGTLRADPLPVIAVPTTAGTGSEVSPSAIVTDTERHKKMNLFDPRICPRVALVDPDLTLSMSAGLTAATGMDALSHAVDSLHCALANPASDALALEGARLVAQYLRRAFSEGADVEARCGMMQASLTAGLAVGITDVSGCHCLAESIGAVYDHPHGVCCAATMPAIMEFNLPDPATAERYARLAAAFGIPTEGLATGTAARLAIDYVAALNADLGIPALADLIRAEDLDLLAEKAAANTSAPSNPRPASVADFREMFARGLAAAR
ncbi:MAG TPA: iron-containing alcohol dehydrogenase [Solirubrobacteraceae bacterium]|nr:iron-containing alcohol dehydrogenase [Solirubrobacteraceae bacterium]